MRGCRAPPPRPAPTAALCPLFTATLGLWAFTLADFLPATACASPMTPSQARRRIEALTRDTAALLDDLRDMNYDTVGMQLGVGGGENGKRAAPGTLAALLSSPMDRAPVSRAMLLPPLKDQDSGQADGDLPPDESFASPFTPSDIVNDEHSTGES